MNDEQHLKTSEKNQHSFTFSCWNLNWAVSQAKSPAHHLTNGAWNRSNAATSHGGSQTSSFYLILSKWERHIKELLAWLIFPIRTLVCDLRVFHGLIPVRRYGTQQSAPHKNPFYPHPLRLDLTESSHAMFFCFFYIIWNGSRNVNRCSPMAMNGHDSFKKVRWNKAQQQRRAKVWKGHQAELSI